MDDQSISLTYSLSTIYIVEEADDGEAWFLKSWCCKYRQNRKFTGSPQIESKKSSQF